MLNEAEKTRNDRIHSRMFQLPSAAPRMAAAAQAQELPKEQPAKTSLDKAEGAAATSPAVDEALERLRTDSVPLTLDEIEWLEAVAQRHGHANVSGVLSRLVDWANAEPSDTKKKLFMVIRCRRCSAGARGGVKRDHEIELKSRQWQWLENVRARASHPTVGKTLRILVDFYMPICNEDPALEQKLLRAGVALKTDRHEDACASVDPSRALAIKHWPASPGYLSQEAAVSGA
eukprot:TRINITY_DN63543_c0_g1_i1.p1 TRINITY_DN63543_c0_g1~~TRINITY_DN63543_c0_g1_i1.p1  ORF type:complete len:267 (+),score=57.91 TRINITY_DN63543_c0_g1_i1:106-801(+)